MVLSGIFMVRFCLHIYFQFMNMHMVNLVGDYLGVTEQPKCKADCQLIFVKLEVWLQGRNNSYQHSITSMLDDLNWLPLEKLRRNKRLTTFYKICNNTSTVTLHEYVKTSNSRTRSLIRATSRSKPTMSSITTVFFHVPSESGIPHLLTWCMPSL